jgi:hypothetical protein
MRLVAQTKLGFYPAHPDAVAAVLGHLRVPKGEVHILDPCCGEGIAIEQIREGLGLPSKHVHAVELDGGRALAARENLGPDANLLGPCSYLEARINANSFGMAWVNPPFDNELGGGRRQEHTFVQNVTKQLRVGGLLVLVMPTTAIQSNTPFQDYLDNWYDEAALYAWPEEHRKYREVVYFGYRREEPLPGDSKALRYLRSLGLRGEPKLPTIGSDPRSWKLKAGAAPKRFEKVKLTDDELWAIVYDSPLNKFLDTPRPIKPKRPPLPLGEGHVALTLASGLLNGLIRAVDGYSFVVRGVATKVPFLAKRGKPETNAKGITSVKEEWLQRPVVKIRGVDHHGKVVDFGEVELKKEEEVKADV